MKQRSIVMAIAVMLAIVLTPVAAVRGQAPPGATTRHQFRAPGVPINGPYEVVHLVLDFAPGAWTPLHTHGGQGIVTVLEGTMTRRAEGSEQDFRPGGSWVEPGVPHQAGNATADPATVMVTFLLPQAAPLTTVTTASPGLPNTGAGGELRPWSGVSLALLVASGGALLGWRCHRTLRRSGR